MAGTAFYDDGTPAAGALIRVSNRKTGVQDAVLATDESGHFEGVLAPGDYAFAVASDRGFAFVTQQTVPALAVRLTLSRDCRPASGEAHPSMPGTRVELYRLSKDDEVFVGEVTPDGRFSLCLPEAFYDAQILGAVRSTKLKFSHPAASPLHLEGVPLAEITRPPRVKRTVTADMASLVADIVQHDARLIALGESTHGTAEFVPTRGALTLELARHAGLGAMLVEIDAIAAGELDDYINGGDVDLSKALPALGFWITDTYEFRKFLDQLRSYNATAPKRIHLWGIDVQNTALPVQLLLANAAALHISPKDRALLERVSPGRGKAVKDFTVAQRTSLDRLLSRLAKPRSTKLSDLRIAIAAQSMAVQLGYWEGDLSGNYSDRRDAGMASLAKFIVTRTGVQRACLWAHDGHIARNAPGEWRNLGIRLAESIEGYYPVAFYLFQGTARAWDAAGEVGVISHPVPPAPPHTVEAAVMAATGSPDVAWVPVGQLLPALGDWLDSLRFVREMGHTYYGEVDLLSLRIPSAAYDAIVVIKAGHDSSPTPTGIRRAEGRAR